jgi:hypothetical protein
MSRKAKAYAQLAVGIVDPKIRAFVALLEASKSAADWLCDAPPGSDQRERGEVLREALKRIETLSERRSDGDRKTCNDLRE